jgi:putative transposase
VDLDSSGGIYPVGINPKRSSLRLPQYDYSQAGADFITLISYQRECVFGKIMNGKLVLSELGEIVREEWFASRMLRSEIQLYEDEFVIMPNHIHGIVWISEVNADVGATGRSPLLHLPSHPSGPASKSLGSFVAGFKSVVTNRINQLNNTPGKKVWMRNYHDRIIRNETELRNIREYISENPLKWELDRENQQLHLPRKYWQGLLVGHPWRPKKMRPYALVLGGLIV